MGRVHAPPFRYPPGWGYQRWSVGMMLPATFLTTAFFWDSYSRVGLPPPPVGARWVRYGPDLVLVEVPSGRILEVAPGVFF
jgi:Ni/Co efflux regulator RcnB